MTKTMHDRYIWQIEEIGERDICAKDTNELVLETGINARKEVHLTPAEKKNVETALYKKLREFNKKCSCKKYK